MYDALHNPTIEEAAEYAKKTGITEFEAFKINGDFLWATMEQVEEGSFNLFSISEEYRGIVDGTIEQLPSNMKVRIETGQIFKFTAVPRLDADGNIIGVIESCQNLEDLEPQIYNFLSNYSQVLSLHLFSADEGLVLTSVEKSGANAHYERGTYHDLESIAERLVDGGILEDFGDNSIVYYSGIDRANVGSAYILMVEFDENYYTNSTFLVNAKIDKLFGDNRYLYRKSQSGYHQRYGTVIRADKNC